MSSTWVRGIVVVVCTLGLAASSWAEGPLSPANDVRRQVERVVPVDKPGIPNVQSGNEQKASSAPRGESLRPATGVGPQDLRQQQQIRITNPMKGRDLKIDVKEDLKNVDKGPADSHAVGTRGLGTGNSPFLGGGSGGMGSGSLRGPAQKIKEKATITGEKYGDTFGADRINDQNAAPIQIGGTKGRAPGGFTGGGKGNAAAPGDGWLENKSRGYTDSQTGSVVKFSRQYDGSTKQEVTFKNGGGWSLIHYKDGSTVTTETRPDGKMTTQTTTSADGTKTTATWDPDREVYVVTAGTPNPQGNDSAGGPIIVLPGSTLGREIKAGMRTQGQAGGPGDGRNPANEGPSGVSDHDRTSIMMGITRGQDAPEKEVGGPINMDRLMEINTKVNPGSQ